MQKKIKIAIRHKRCTTRSINRQFDRIKFNLLLTTTKTINKANIWTHHALFKNLAYFEFDLSNFHVIFFMYMYVLYVVLYIICIPCIPCKGSLQCTFYINIYQKKSQHFPAEIRLKKRKYIHFSVKKLAVAFTEQTKRKNAKNSAQQTIFSHLNQLFAQSS